MVSRIVVSDTEFKRADHGLSRAASFPCVEAAWELEADRREAALQSGAVAEVSAQDAVRRLQAKIIAPTIVQSFR